MTREEEIKYASKDYVNYLLDKQEYHNENYTEDDIQQAFEKCAQWADENPKSPWISVNDDLPCNHSDLVLTYNDTPFLTKRVIVATDIHTLFLCDMKKDNDRGWIWNYSTKDKITHWFPIPELPKE